MELILLIVIAALAVISIVLSLAKGNNHAQAEQLQAALRQQMQENREELNRSIRELRMKMTQTLNQNMQQLHTSTGVPAWTVYAADALAATVAGKINLSS